jgi:hypothetical protein
MKRKIVRIVCATALCLYLGAALALAYDIATSLRTLADAMHPFKVWVSVQR